MKKLFTALLAATVTVGGVAATPAMAQDHGRGYYQRDYRDGYQNQRRGYRDGYRNYRGYDRNYYRRCSSGTTGTVLGAVVGGLLGGEIGRGSSYRGRSTTGTIIGAGAGALLGREVDGGNCRGRAIALEIVQKRSARICDIGSSRYCADVAQLLQAPLLQRHHAVIDAEAKAIDNEGRDERSRDGDVSSPVPQRSELNEKPLHQRPPSRMVE